MARGYVVRDYVKGVGDLNKNLIEDLTHGREGRGVGGRAWHGYATFLDIEEKLSFIWHRRKELDV